MELGSYRGRILHVNLTNGMIETKELDIELCRKFIGDFGVSLALAYDLIEPGVDPLSPGNVIIIGAGPLVGTPYVAPRCSVLTKNPLTGVIAFGSTGMGLGRKLRSAGFDQVVFTGRSKVPVYLKITDGTVQICEAGHLWGKDIYETTEELWNQLGKGYSVMAIGQAGENLVNASVVLVDKMSGLGSAGLAAVMGSKNLKAVAVTGKKKVPLFDPVRFRNAIAPVLKAHAADTAARQNMIRVGKFARIDMWADLGILYKNWTEIYPKEEVKKRYSIEEYLRLKGSNIPPCRDDCPAGVDIPRFIRFITQGKPAEALAVIREKIPFPSVCGRVCTHPCETRCQRNELDEPVAIRTLHRIASRNDNGLWKLKLKVPSPTKKRVAIIGSGPGGLTASYYLARCGHLVTVFEALPEPGGMMRFGIPHYRLPKDILKAEIEEIRNIGVEIKTNAKIDSLDELFMQGYHAILVAIGAHNGLKLPIPGGDLGGVLIGTSWLRDVNLGKEANVGKRVVVLGGGSVGFDCARTAVRLGASDVHVVCLEPRDRMLAQPEEVEQGEEEGITIHPSETIRRILGENGYVTGVECIGVSSFEFGNKGKAHIETVEGSEHILPADTVVFAIGQMPEIPDQFRLPRGAGDTLRVNSENLSTPRDGVFAAGDAAIGTASVIKAIAAGRRAAISIDKYLGGAGSIDEVLAPPEEAVILPERLEEAHRPRVPTLPVEQRLGNFGEVELKMSEETAIQEAKRCLSCDLKAGCAGCVYPCKDVLEIKEGEFAGLTTNVSSFIGRIWQVGIRCGADSLPRTIKLMDIANRYGINIQVFAPTFEFAIELYERGIITKNDTGGLVLKRGFETSLELLKKVTFREGIGELLGKGPLAIIEQFGKECEKYSCHIKGMEVFADARGLQNTMTAWANIVNIEGGHCGPAHTMDLRITEKPISNQPAYSQDLVKAYCEKIGITGEALKRSLYKPVGYNVARITKYAQDFYTLLTCLGVCEYRHPFFNKDNLAELYSAATGIEISPDEIMKAAERVWNLYRAINVREGQSRKDDRVPPRWFEPLKTRSGEEIHLADCVGKPLSAQDMERLLDDYYDERGWDLKAGIPSKEKLLDLGLMNVVEDFKRLGVF